MRVLHVSSGNLYGGVETLLVTLARFRALCPVMEHRFALSFEGRLSKELAEAGATIYQLGQVRARKPWSVWAARKRLSELLFHEDFDAVVCHMCWPLAVFGKAVRPTTSLLAFWAHDALNGRHWVERWAGRATPDLVIANSRFTRGTISTVFPRTPSTVIYPPADLSNMYRADHCRSAVRAELGVRDDTTVIVQVSRMEAWKGHRLHLEGLAKLTPSHRWACWMVGGAQRPAEAKYLASLRRAADQLGIAERVRFLGQRSDVPRLLHAADIFCQPNLGPEPFGLVFIEALSAGLPVVTTAMGGAKEIVDGSCGLAVAPNQPEQLAHELQRLIDCAELRVRMGQHGPERVRELCDPGRRMQDLHEALVRAAHN